MALMKLTEAWRQAHCAEDRAKCMATVAMQKVGRILTWCSLVRSAAAAVAGAGEYQTRIRFTAGQFARVTEMDALSCARYCREGAALPIGWMGEDAVAQL